ncbi:MAG: hypothetical protein KDD45_04130, partial [Bdellovibrionales bacterium]|nr:hypothetical protein [Bdellovibrionales bacterium]
MPQKIKVIALVLVSLLFTFGVQSKSFANSNIRSTKIISPAKNRVQNWVRVDSGRDLFFDFIYPQGNQPIVVFLNGLTATTENWEKLTQSLAVKGIGSLRFDFYGQGKTLAK